MSKSLLILGCVLVAIGLAIFGYEVMFRVVYGCDATDVAGISQGFIIDWPTGERPSWAMVPAYTYSFGFWLLALAVFVIRCRMGRGYSGRIWRGAE